MTGKEDGRIVADPADRDYQGKLGFQSKGWQVSGLDDHAVFDSATGRKLIILTQQDEAAVCINCYAPGAADEMHCHPGSEHTFLVWRGKLHVTGVEEGEEWTLAPGQFVHIAAGYYYRLHNPGPEPAVYCQFRTISAKPPKRGMVLFEESARGKSRVSGLGSRASGPEGDHLPRLETPDARPRTVRTKGWQVSGVEENMVLDRSAYVPLTAQQSSSVILNCYPSGQHDEMHCHPNEEHVFAVWRGKLHLTGVEEGEDLTLERGQFVHIDANYYYRLHNPGPAPAVYTQFRTLPARPPERRIVLFSESNRAKRPLRAGATPVAQA